MDFDDVCYCANCRSEGEYEFRTGTVPVDCKFYNWKQCQGCNYYGRIDNAERLCPLCYAAYRRSPQGAQR